jgi:hypothetical protein
MKGRKTGKAAWTLGVIGLGLYAGCANVIGADDYKVAPSGSSVGAGEALCDTTCTGPGLVCQHSTFGTKGLCTYGCVDDSGCASDHVCIGATDPADNFPASCLVKCVTTCPSGMFCGKIDLVGTVCVPTDWFGGGVGDECTDDPECKSGMCRNKPAGWCSKPCGVGNSLCATDDTNVSNTHGEVNWCTDNLGGIACVPGCTLDDADCQFYPGTTCMAITDVTGSMARACLP